MWVTDCVWKRLCRMVFQVCPRLFVSRVPFSFLVKKTDENLPFSPFPLSLWSTQSPFPLWTGFAPPWKSLDGRACVQLLIRVCSNLRTNSRSNLNLRLKKVALSQYLLSSLEARTETNVCAQISSDASNGENKRKKGWRIWWYSRIETGCSIELEATL